MSYTISKATLADTANLNLLVNSAYRGESSRKGWTTEADFLDGIRTDEEGLKEIINDTQSQILKCSSKNCFYYRLTLPSPKGEGFIGRIFRTVFKCRNERNEIIGCVHLKKKGDQLYLGMLTVSPELQNKGIGKLLLKAAEAEAVKLNCNRIYMTVLTERSELIAWYERHGYVNTRQIEPFPMGNPRFGLPKKFLEFVVMEKSLKFEV